MLATEHFAAAVLEIRFVVIVALVKMSVSLLLEDLYPMAMVEAIQLNPYAILHELTQEHAASNSFLPPKTASFTKQPNSASMH